MERYRVIMAFNVWADSDDEALRFTKQFAEEFDKKQDNEAEILEVWQRFFGALETKRIYPKPSEVN